MNLIPKEVAMELPILITPERVLSIAEEITMGRREPTVRDSLNMAKLLLALNKNRIRNEISIQSLL